MAKNARIHQAFLARFVLDLSMEPNNPLPQVSLHSNLNGACVVDVKEAFLVSDNARGVESWLRQTVLPLHKDVVIDLKGVKQIDSYFYLALLKLKMHQDRKHLDLKIAADPVLTARFQGLAMGFLLR